MKRYKKEEVVQAIIDMRIRQMASTKTCLDFLMTQMGYKQSYSYDLIREASQVIADHYKELNKNSLEESIAQWEVMAEESKKTKNYKQLIEIKKELGKLKGHYIDKIDISGSIEQNIQVIKIISPPEKKSIE